MRRCSLLILAVILLAGALSSGAVQETRTLSFLVGSGQTLHLEHPSSWTPATGESSEGGLVIRVVTFTAGAEAEFALLLSPIWRDDFRSDSLSAGQVRTTVEEMVDRVRGTAVETDIPLFEVNGPAMSGYAYSVTDRSPGPREYKYMTQGWAFVGAPALSFTILSQDQDDPRIQQALEIVRSARHSAGPATAGSGAGSSLRKLTFPGKPWALVLDLPGFPSPCPGNAGP